MILLFFACSTAGISLEGKAVSSGNPVSFIELCEKGDETAVEIKETTQKESCKEAGEVLANIRQIDFNHSKTQTVNLSVLKSLTNLEKVGAYGRNISDISALSDLLRLQEIYLMRNNISDITPLKELEHVRFLRLDGNQISDISVLSNLKKLEKLGLDANKITDARPIAKLSRVQDLNINFNSIDLEKCPMKDVPDALYKICKQLKENQADMQDAIDPKN